MGAATKILRRTFLVGSMAVAGGVAFGYYAVKKPHDNPLADGLGDDEATFNPWVKISPETITLITPHADIGQGVASMQAALIAEEMDLEFGQFEIDFGPSAPAYYNSAIGAELLPTLTTDTSFGAQKTRELGRAAAKLLGLQVTGGSSSAANSYERLRKAGAVARETLKTAASKKSGVPVAQLKTGGGAVILPDGIRFTYQELAAEAAKLRPVQNVALRDPSEWRLVGQQMQRLDVIAKSTGTQDYGIDLVMDGMVHAAVKVNPRQGGSLNGYDASAAETMRGVRKILPVTNGLAVIADNSWRAFRAADAIDYDWGPASYPAEQADHWAEVAASFTEARLDQEWRHDGNAEAPVEGADVIETEYRAPYVAHAPLEPIGALILVTDERVDFWTSHQIPGFCELKVAGITGHDLANVHFHNQYGGGSFGHRLEFENITLAAEIGNQMRGTPVKLTYSREEDFAHDFPRQITMSRGRGSVAGGRVETYDLSIASVSAGASQSTRMGQAQPGPDSQIPAGAWNLPYAIPNFRVRAYKVPELAPVSSWRSVGASSAGFFADAFLDELIHAAGADPMEERLRLMAHDISRKVLEAVADMSNWGSDLGPGRGRGVAFVESFGVPVAEVVEVTDTEEGIRIDKVFVAIDAGRVIDPDNFDNQVKGGVVWGLGHAMNSEITYSDGMAEQTNYHAHEGMRLYQCPEIIVRGLENGPVRGIGEPPVPPAAPALANAIFAATGKRLREMPFNKHIDFV